MAAFDLEQDGARHVASADPKMAELIAQVGAITLPRRRGRYESLVRAIIAQQLSTAAARTIFERVRQRAGAPLTPQRLAQVDDATLLSCGLSRAKLASVRDLTDRCVSRRLQLERVSRLPDAEVISRLTEVRGIGVWSAEMFLIFVMTRPDVLPVTDLGIRKGFQKIYRMRELPDRARMEKIASKWRPYRTVGSWYLWRSLEL